MLQGLSGNTQSK